MITKVASIFFAPVRAERMYGGPYELPAVPLGAEPAILTITDRPQFEQGPYQLGSNGKRARRRYHVLGEVIARCIVAEWSQNGVGMTPQCRPGIWVVREQLPLLNENGTPQLDADGIALWRMASDEEREAMWAEDFAAAKKADRSYANMLFIQANGMADDPRLIPYIAPNARIAAKHYGLEAEWLKEEAALHVKQCPYCTKVIPAKAIKCPKCTEVVDVPGYARLEAEKKAYLNDINNKKQFKVAAEKELELNERLARQAAEQQPAPAPLPTERPAVEAEAFV
jgi:hypothetical protein